MAHADCLGPRIPGVFRLRAYHKNSRHTWGQHLGLDTLVFVLSGPGAARRLEVADRSGDQTYLRTSLVAQPILAVLFDLFGIINLSLPRRKIKRDQQ